MSFDDNESNGPEVVNPQEGQFVEVEPVRAAPPVSNVPSSTPSFGEPVNSGEVPSYTAPSGDKPKKDNKKTWIIIAIVLVVLCCCCLIVVLGGASLMDNPDIQDMLEDYMYFFQSIPSFASAWLAA